jgi:hypothetical protein
MTTNAPNTMSMTEIHDALTQRLIALGRPEDAAEHAAIMIWNWDKQSDLMFYAYCDTLQREGRKLGSSFDSWVDAEFGMDKEVERLLYASLEAHFIGREPYPPDVWNRGA